MSTDIPLKNGDHANRYAYRVVWSAEDGEYVGLCTEFPSLSWLAESHESALKGIIALVQECVEDMAASGESIPEPMSIREYSGRFVIRIPPEIHRKLAMRAAENGVSLNRYISAKLAE